MYCRIIFIKGGREENTSKEREKVTLLKEREREKMDGRTQIMKPANSLQTKPCQRGHTLHLVFDDRN